jgi:hypothetical protein
MNESPQEDQQNNPITRDEVRRMLAETEKNITEGRLKFLLFLGAAFLVVFGVIVPMWLTNTSSEKVDTAIKDMRADFEKLAGEQLRKPDIQCLFEGKPLEGAVLTFTHIDDQKNILIKNTGDRSAFNIQAVLYAKEKVGSLIGGAFGLKDVSDEPDFDYVYVYNISLREFSNLHADSFAQIHFRPWTGLTKLETPAMLKIHYGQPEPKVFRFTIKAEPK